MRARERHTRGTTHTRAMRGARCAVPRPFAPLSPATQRASGTHLLLLLAAVAAASTIATPAAATPGVDATNTPPTLSQYGSVVSSLDAGMQSQLFSFRGRGAGQPTDPPLWMGGDCATSFQAGAGRYVWLFGDTLVGAWDAQANQRQRVGVDMPHSTAAVQSVPSAPRRQPRATDVTFTWREALVDASEADATAPAPQPVSLVNPMANMSSPTYWCPTLPPEGSTTPLPRCEYLWPISGIAENASGDGTAPDDPGRLLLLAVRVQNDPAAGGFGFKVLGTAAIVVANGAADPSTWQYTLMHVPGTDGDTNWWTAIASDPDTPGYVYLLGTGIGGTMLARARIGDLLANRWSTVQYWGLPSGGGTPTTASNPTTAATTTASPASGVSLSPEWVTGDSNVASLHPVVPAPSPTAAGPSEASLVFDPRLQLWLMPVIPAFSTEIDLWSAPDVTGPWTQRPSVFTITNVDTKKQFCYAPKLHPQLAAPQGGWPGSPAKDNLVEHVLTFACNAHAVADLFAAGHGGGSWYVPQVVRVTVDLDSAPGGSGDDGFFSTPWHVAGVVAAAAVVVGCTLAVVIYRRQAGRDPLLSRRLRAGSGRSAVSHASLPREATYRWQAIESASSFSEAEVRNVVDGPAGGELVHGDHESDGSFSYVKM